MAEQPLWRRLFDAVNQQVGPRLEDYTRSETFADVLAALSRINQHVISTGEEFSGQVLRLLNLPTAKDIANLNKRLEAIDRRLQRLGEGQHAASRD